MNNDYLKLVRRLKLWVVLLSVLNITIVSTIGVNLYLSKKREALNEKSVKGTNNFFAQYLQLDSCQIALFDSVSANYSSSLKEVGLMLRSVKQRMNIPGIENDTVAMSKIYEDFISAQSLNRDLAIIFYNNVREICDSVQISKFDTLISKITVSQDYHKSKSQLK
ncbi:MAG: hypothetical protein Q8R90_04700 [Bacteroidales bacterium]|jgi:hypothetical protein|nr:hypothetical protein [Bacteroidales bacterium]